MIRKRYKSILDFEKAHGLPRHAVTDVLGGKSRPAAARKLADVLGYPIHELFPGRYTADGATIIRRTSRTHRLNRVAK